MPKIYESIFFLVLKKIDKVALNHLFNLKIYKRKLLQSIQM